MPVCKILIGVPASGKTTWVLDQEDWSEAVLSSDNIIEEIAFEYGMTYNEAFRSLIKFADEVLERDAVSIAENGEDVIVDRTNVSRKSRKRWIDHFKSYGYTFEAYVFPVPDAEEHHRRLNNRPGKTIPADVINSMIRNFEFPNEDEGFSKIVVVDNGRSA